MVAVKTKDINKELAIRLKRSNVFSLPKVDKVVLNVGVGRAVVSSGKGILEPIMKDLAKISGQKPSIRPAKKSVASFKLRQGQPAGLMVTLRGKRAQDFITRLVAIALPRTRDFRGLPLSSIDKNGNLSIGIREHTVFPETALDPTGARFSVEATIVLKAKKKEEAVELLRLLGFPLQKES